MEQPPNHPLTVDDNFYKAALNELSNIEAYLKPQLYQVLQRRAEVATARATLSSSCIPKMIQFKEAAETQNISELLARFEELEKLNKSLEQRFFDSSCKSIEKSDN